MNVKDMFSGLLKSVAPTIATAVGGPMGGIAMKFLADKFTDGDTGKVEDYLLSADPQDLKELKTADMEFRKHMKELDIDLERIHAGDRDSARKLAMSQGTKPQIVMSLVYSASYFVVLYLFISGRVQVMDGLKELVGTLLGVLTTLQVQISNFWFGSSAGSKHKTDALAAK